MDFLQSGVRTLKRHSISNISDVIRNHVHRDSLTNLGRSIFSPSRNNLPLKNADFESISAAVVHLFQKKKLQENELASLQESVRNLMTTDAGPLIYDYYKDKLMKKGMVILRETIKHETGLSLLEQLGEQWQYLYTEILPTLQALLYPVKTKLLTVRQVTLLEFRNTVVLKLPVKDALKGLKSGEAIPPSTSQMLLVLHGVQETPCTDNSIELEKLLAKVTSPCLGRLGLYTGGSEPEIRSSYKAPTKQPIPVIHVSDDDMFESDDELGTSPHRTRRHHLSPLVTSHGHHHHHHHHHHHLHHHHKRPHGLLHHPLLEAVKEQDRGQIRRYSIATS